MFYDRLLELCQENGKKITPVVRELGLSTGGIARWRNGSVPDGDTLYKIAKYFDVSVDYLLGKSNVKKPSKNGELENNMVKFIGRNGTVVCKRLSPEIIKMLESIPDSDEDL